MLIASLFIFCMMVSAILGASLPVPKSGKGPPDFEKKETAPGNMFKSPMKEKSKTKSADEKKKSFKEKSKSKQFKELEEKFSKSKGKKAMDKSPENMKEKGKELKQIMPKGIGNEQLTIPPEEKPLGKLGNKKAVGKSKETILSKENGKSNEFKELAKKLSKSPGKQSVKQPPEDLNPTAEGNMMKQMISKGKREPSKSQGEKAPGKLFGNPKADGKKESSMSMKLKMQKPEAMFGDLGKKNKGKSAKFPSKTGKSKNGKVKNPWKSAKPIGKMSSNMGPSKWGNRKPKMGPRMWGKLKSKGMVNFVDPRSGFKVAVAIYVEPARGRPPFPEPLSFGKKMF